MRVSVAPGSGELSRKIEKLWELSARKIRAIEKTFDPARGSPVLTIDGIYSSRGWTDWTQGFQFGSAILQFDATGETEFLDVGRENTVARMSAHVTHMGVHDHGFNNVSTYGTLLRLMNEGRIPEDPWERRFYEIALKASGAVQARRWTKIAEGGGFIHSFNGPHSLFSDTIRSLRSLAVAHSLGQVLMEENDRRVSLLERLFAHAHATARFNVYYGEGRDAYDVPGRVVHESIFNVVDGRYRCPSTQQGYSPFSTWTRGLAWVILGYAEQLEFLESLAEEEIAEAARASGLLRRQPRGVTSEGKPGVVALMRKALQATADFYIENTALDGIPYWDTGAPGLAQLPAWQELPADPFNPHEPVDSSAAAIACQGLMRFAGWLRGRGEPGADRYSAAGLTVLSRLLEEPYLSLRDTHQGLLLHSIYHRPNGWDRIPPGQKVPSGESSMWGDYHLREAALYAQRAIRAEGPPFFWKKRRDA